MARGRVNVGGGANEWGGLEFVVNGGELGRLYFAGVISNKEYHEIDLETFLPITSVDEVSDNMSTGGVSNRLYRTLDSQGSGAILAEFNPDTLISISSIVVAATYGGGVGGTKSDRLFRGDRSPNELSERDLDTKLSLNSISQRTKAVGCSSDNRGFYNDNYATDNNVEFNLDTLLPINSVIEASGASINDIGGDGNSNLYTVDSVRVLSTLDQDTLLVTGTIPLVNSSMKGIGGLKTGGPDTISITSVLFNGAEYELTDDSDFRVSGVIV